MAQHDAIDDYRGGTLPRELVGSALSIKQLWVILWAYRKVILIVPVVFALVSAILLKFVLPKVYQATATLFVAYKVDDPVSGGDFSQITAMSFMATQVELIQSPGTLLAVVDKLKLHEKEEFVSSYRGDGSPDSVRRWAATKLKSRLTVATGQGSRFLYVSADDKDPVMAATLSNAVADAYVDEQLRQFTDPAKERIGRYGPQLENLRKNVDAAQAKITQFRKRTGLINLTEKTDLDSTRLLELDKRLTEATAARQLAELRLSRVGQGDIAILSSQLVQNLKSQMQLKEAQLSELRGSLGPRHPQIVSLTGELEQLRAQLNREIGVYTESARAEVESARAIESKLRAELDQQRAQTMATRSHQDESAALLQELESATKVYQSALDAFEQAQLGTQLAASNVTIASRASPPSRAKGNRLQQVLLATVLGFLFAAVGSLVYELMNRRIRCREDLEHDLGTHVLVELRASA
jgi:polysaccharide biosynthesis transport protein